MKAIDYQIVYNLPKECLPGVFNLVDILLRTLMVSIDEVISQSLCFTYQERYFYFDIEMEKGDELPTFYLIHVCRETF